MKIELCSFSALKIYPGRGRRLVRADGRLLIFLNSKCERNYLMRRNPRKICWTILYRRKHKKGQQEEEKKKKMGRRIVKTQRAIMGASLAEIMQKRSQPAELRQQQREHAIKVAKDKQRQKETAKRAAKIKELKNAQQQQQKQHKASKPMQKGRPHMGVPR